MKTLADSAYAALRRDIISGALAPGMPLRMAFLCDRYGMGMSPVREALNRLQAERLVTAISLRGFFVAPLSVEELSDTTDTRILIEGQALQRSIARGGADWADGVRGALSALLDGAAQPDADRLEQLHHAFHRALVAGCGSRWLLDLFEKLYSESERFRFHALTVEARDGTRDLAAEHRAIADAALARDTLRAVELLTAHYRRTETELAARLPVAPDPKPSRRRGKAPVTAAGSAAPA